MPARMTFVSLFAGARAGGFDLAFERAGFECVGQCEIDPVAMSVLTRHWPSIPKHDDVTTIRSDTFEHPEVVTFGFPCQDISVAGARAGMVDGGTRSGLFYDAVRYIRQVQEASGGHLPRFAVLENVPGLYSSNDGHDFATVLEVLVGGTIRRPTLGWRGDAGVVFGPLGCAEWRTLDTQHFGPPQRRRRIFLVLHLGGDRAGQVLLEPNSLSGHPPKGRAPGQGITGALTGGPGSSSAGNPDDNRAQAGFLVPVWKRRGGFGWSERTDGVSPALEAQGGSHQGGPENIPIVPVAFSGKDYGQDAGSVSPTLRAMSHTNSHMNGGGQVAIAFQESQTGVREYAAAGTLRANGPGHDPVGTRIRQGYAVRRLTAREYERLQGFPDDWTRHRPGGTEIADTHRYRLMGNAVSVPVAEWIGRRLA